MGKMKIGIQMYSLRNEMAEDFPAAFQKVKEMGYDGVELAGLYGRTAEEVKAMCEELDIIPLSAHVLHTELIADDSLLDAYAKIGCKYMVIPFLDEMYRPGKEKFEEFLEDARKLGERANKLGMKLCYHNHGFEFQKVDGEYGLDIIYRELSADLMGTEFDTCWIEYMGEDSCAYIRKYADRTEIIHLKDFVVKMEDGKKVIEFRPMGSGTLDIKAIINAANDIDAKWLIVEQDEPTPGKTALECVKESIEYLRK